MKNSGTIPYIYKRFVSGLLLLALLSSACFYRSQKPDFPYDKSEKKKLDALAELQGSVLQLICTAKYENYYYAPPPNIEASVDQQSLLQEVLLHLPNCKG